MGEKGVGKLSRETPPPCEGEPMGADRYSYVIELYVLMLGHHHYLTGLMVIKRAFCSQFLDDGNRCSFCGFIFT